MDSFILNIATQLEPSALYVLATPIGNIADISLRAISAMQQADVLCAEDTRVTQVLLKAYGIKAKSLVSLREQNEIQMAHKVCQWLQAGKSVVQVSDAGTPGICDPGSRLVELVRESNYKVFCIPGPCAITGALSILGMTIDAFQFIGFLPSKLVHKRQQLETISKVNQIVVCYDVPHRIVSTMEMIVQLMPLRKIYVVRELTKTFETVLHGTAQMILEIMQTDTHQQRGEMVIIFENNSMIEAKLTAEIKEIAAELVRHMPIKQAILYLEGVAQFKKKELYQYLLEIKRDH